MAHLTICELNTENLFISLDYYEGQSFENLSEKEWKEFALVQMRKKQKPLKKLWGLAAAINDIAPDILMLIEVGGKESLDHFNHYFLDNNYISYFIESNSKRGIDLAFLVKKSLDLNVKVGTNRQTPVTVNAYQGSHSTKFSRDVAEMRVFDKDSLQLILLLTHLKSKISTDRDFQGADMRKAEAIALANIYENLRKDNPETPIVVGGDFNSDLSSPELELLTRTDLTDFHTLLKTPKEERISLVHFDYKGNPHPQILDYLLVSPQLVTKIVHEKSRTYRYKSFYDIAHPLPTKLDERYQLPSDHYPLVLTLAL